MTTLTLIRGLPGSGKSTLAAKLLSQDPDFAAVVVEADMFFIDFDGMYQYNPKLIRAAHAWCYGVAARALKDGKPVIVSNTFTQFREMEKYFELADIIDGLKIQVIEMTTQYQNVHGVPEDKVQRMKDRWEEIPGDWRERIALFRYGNNKLELELWTPKSN